MIRSYFERFLRRPLRGLRTIWFALPQARMAIAWGVSLIGTLSASFAGWLNDFFQQFSWLRPWPRCVSVLSVASLLFTTEARRTRRKHREFRRQGLIRLFSRSAQS